MAGHKYKYAEKHIAGLPIYVLMFGINVEGDWYRNIYGISYDMETIEKMISDLGPMPNGWEEGDYYVVKAGQLREELYQTFFELKEPIDGECYIVATGGASDMIEEYQGVFKDRQTAFDYATGVLSFEEINPDTVYLMKATVDEIAPDDGFDVESLESIMEEMY